MAKFRLKKMAAFTGPLGGMFWQRGECEAKELTPRMRRLSRMPEFRVEEVIPPKPKKRGRPKKVKE